MSQAGIVDFEGSHPQVPTIFITNSGTAVPLANTLEILANAVVNHAIPILTLGSGNIVIVQTQFAGSRASSLSSLAGLASFNSADFNVDANGYVSLSGGAAVETFAVDAATSPGTNPVLPNSSGQVTITGGQVAAGTTINVIQINSLAANTYTVQIQRSQAVASSTVGDNGVSHFNSAYFTVDTNGFVSLNGAAVGQTITGNTGGALSPTAGNWNILGSGSITASGSGSTLTIELTGLTNHAVQVGGTSTTLTQVGPSATTGAVLASNGAAADPSFQTIASLGAITTITGNSGGAESPSSGNFNILGTGSITVAGTANTETVQLTGLTNHAVLVGAGTATITKVGPTSTSGQVLQSSGSSADPAFSTATYPSTITANELLYSSSSNTISGLATTNDAGLVTSGGGTPTWIAYTSPGFLAQSAGGVVACRKFSVKNQVFTSSGTYTPSTNMLYCSVQCLGGGGAGGGAPSTSVGQTSTGGGGGSGQYAVGIFSAATIGASQTVTIGAGGTTNSGAAGGNGGTTSLGALISAGGGGGGSSSGAGTSGTANGGSAGSGGSGGDYTASGTIGLFGITFVSSITFSGQGASSQLGSGGQPNLFGSSGGNAGAGYGAGGSGGLNQASQGANSGGAGTSGILIVTEYIIN